MEDLDHQVDLVLEAQPQGHKHLQQLEPTRIIFHLPRKLVVSVMEWEFQRLLEVQDLDKQTKDFQQHHLAETVLLGHLSRPSSVMLESMLQIHHLSKNMHTQKIKTIGSDLKWRTVSLKFFLKFLF